MSIKALPRKTLFTSILLANALLGASSYAGPQGGNITHGSGSIGTQGNTTSILQNSNQLIIDWNNFNVNSNETVNFHQPGADSVALNNILQYDASRINGQINANGQVILINPRGLIFGSGAEINTAGLIVSSLSIAKKSFLNGEFAFKDLDDSQGVIINNGAIHASSGGITLLGESVINNGIIQAELGYINLAAGKQAFLSFDEQGFLGVKIDQDVINNELGLEQAIENNGELSAGGRVAISAKVTSELFDRAINNTGLIKATGFNLPTADESPSISLNSNGDINNSGTLDASNHQTVSNNNIPVQTNGGQVAIEGKQVIHTGTIDVSSDFGKGGKVDILGDQVGLAGGAIVNADGEQGGGDIQIGGSYQGKDTEVKNAEATYVGEGTKISANAGTTGDGGDVVVWADKTTRYYGDIEAKGGSQSGNGGDVEVSGKQTLSFDGSVDTSAENGLSGELLLDPATLNIVADGDDSKHSSDSAGEVTFTEQNTAKIKASTIVELLVNSRVKLTATDLISVDSVIDSTSSNTLELLSGGSIDVNALIKVGGGLELTADTVTGSVNLVAGLDASTIQLTGQTLTGSGNISVVDNLTIKDVVDATGYGGVATATGTAASFVTSSNNNSFTLTGNHTEFGIGSAKFSGFSDVDAGDAGSLTGTAGIDDFVVTGAGSVETKGTTFNGIVAVSGEGGDDDVQYDSTSWTVQGTEATSIDGVTFSDIESINKDNSAGTTDRSLTGTTGDDNFVAVATNAVSANGITYYGIGTVDASDGLDDVQSNSANWTVQGTEETSVVGITFSDIETVNKNNSAGITDRNLNGTIGQDLLNIEGTNTISANGITYYGIGTVDALGETDTVTGSTTWDLLAGGFEAFDISFTSVEVANSGAVGTLNGTTSQNLFTIKSNQSVEVNGTTFNQVTTVNAGDDNTDTVTGLSGQAWTIESEGFSGSQISFTGTEKANSLSEGSVTGTDQDESFETTGVANQVVLSDYTFDGITTVNALGHSNTDSLFTNNSIDESFLINASEQIIGNGITFSNFEDMVGEAGDSLVQESSQFSYNLVLNTGVYTFVENPTAGTSSITNTDYTIGTNADEVSFNGLSTSGTETFFLEKVGGKYQVSVLVDGVTKVTSAQFLSLLSVDGIDSNDTFIFDSTVSLDSSINFNANAGLFTSTLSGAASATEFSSFKIYDLSLLGSDLAIGFTSSVAATFSLINGTNNQFSFSGIEFYGFNNVNSTSGLLNTIIGSNQADSFTTISGNDLTANGIAFNDIATVNAGLGDDDIESDLAAWAIQAASNATTVESIDFTGIDTINKNNSAGITDRSLAGTAGNDAFASEETNVVSANGITYYGIGTVDGMGGDDDVEHDSTSWTVQGMEATSIEGITFTDVESINKDNSVGITNRSLTGTAGDDNFLAVATNAVSANGITYYGIGTVDAGDGLDDVQSNSANWTVQGTEETSVDGIIFSDMETVNKNNSAGITDRNLDGTSGQNVLNIEDTNTISASGITYYGIGSVDGLGETDTVTGSTTWDLLAGGFEAFDISFTRVELANSGAAGILNGTTAADKFVVAGTQSVAANGTTFNQITSVTANDGDDDVQYDSADWTIQGTEASSIEGIAFTDVESINQFNSTDITNRNLNGTTDQDLLNIEGINTISANGITYYGIGTVDALGNSTADLDTVSGSTTWDLLADGFKAFGISFTGVEIANSGSAGILSGTTASDKFVVAGSESVAANGTTFNQVTSVTAGDGDDDVQSDVVTWAIEGEKATTVNGVAFTGVESINQFNSTGITTRNLNGTTGQDLLNIESTNAISANGITYYGIGSVDALGETDTVTGSKTWDLLAGGFEAFDISFTGVEIANSGVAGILNGTTDADKFVVAGTQSVAANGTTFNQVTSVTANDGDDDVQYDSADWTIQGTEASSIEGIAFTDVESINQFNSNNIINRNLNGTTGQDLLNIKGTNTVSASGITYYGIGTVDAKGNDSDTVIGLSGQTWTINRSDSSLDGFTGSGVIFKNTEIADSQSSGTLIGTDYEDYFKTTGVNNQIIFRENLTKSSFVFYGITNVEAGQQNQVYWNIADVVFSDNGESEAFEVNGGVIKGSDITFTGFEKLYGESIDTLTSSASEVSYNLELNSGVYSFGSTFGDEGIITYHYEAVGGYDTVSFVGLANASTEIFTLKKNENGKYQIVVSIGGVEVESAEFLTLLSVDGLNNNDEFIFDSRAALESTISFDASSNSFNASLTGAESTLFSNFKIYDLSALGNDHTLDFTGTAVASTFSLVNSENNKFSFSGTEFHGFNSVTSSYTPIDGDLLNTLTGSDQADRFSITSDNQFTANGIVFSDIGTVHAGLGDDDIAHDSTGWIVKDANETKIGSIDFTGIDTVNKDNSLNTTNRTLTGTTGDDAFAYEGTNAVSANGITYYGIGSVNGAGEGVSGDDVQHNSASWTIQGSEATSIEGIAFTDIESINQFNSTSITNRNLNGTAGQDLLTIEGTNAISANGITYYGIGTVDALGNSEVDLDTVTGSTIWDLLADGFKASGISFTGVETANSIAAGTLNGTTDADKFVVVGSESVAANGTTFNQVTAVTANDGDDDVQYDSADWTIQGTEATSIEGIAFTDVESINQFNSTNISNRNLNGTTGQDLLNIEGTNTISANGITYYGIGSVDALGDTDTVSGSSAWDLLVSGFEAFDISFTGVEIANSGAAGELNGTPDADKFVVAGTQSVAANGTTFNQVTSVTAGDGDDDVQSDSTNWNIEGVNATTVDGIAFTDVESVNQFNSTNISNRNLNGTTGQDLLNIESANTISAKGVTYYGIGSVDALGNSESGLDTVSGGTTWDLLASGFEAFDISFAGVELANSSAAGTLNGTAAADKFVVDGTQSVAANGTTFNQVTSVTAGDGSDDVQYDSADWTIQGAEATSIEGIAFTDVESINQFNSTNISNRNLNGTTGQDLLNIEGTNAISANGITYYGIGSVDALGETDTVTGSTTWDLLVGGFEAFDINFTGVEIANSGAAGILNGTTAADKFVVSGTQSVAANGTTFNQVTSVAGGDGDDDVQYDSADWTIQGTESTSIEGIAFTDVESINQFNSTDITTRNLNGTTGQDLLNIEGTNTISANGITYYGIGSVDALGNSESGLDTVTGSTTWDLLASGFEAFDISFSGVELANSGAAGILNGTTAADKFVVAGTQSVTANGTTFNQVTSVTANDGNDDVQSDVVNWTIEGEKATRVNGITFSGIESINKFNSVDITNRNLNGTTGQDLLNIEGTNTISANGITYYGIGSVDALGNSESGLDTVTGSTTWDLLASGFEAFDISFSGVELANSGAAGILNGTAAADKFVVAGTQSVAANGTTFNQVTSVIANDGDDDVQYDSLDWTIQGAKATSLEGIAFTDVESINQFNSTGITTRNLNGTAGQDLLNIEGTNAISANGITYYGIGSVDALGNSVVDLDAVSGSTTWDLLASGFKAFDISFSGVEIANSGAAGTLNGTTGADKFFVVGSESVVANGTTFNQVTAVTANDGDDDVQYDSVNWTTQGSKATSIEGIAFTDIESINQFNSAGITNRNLNGTNGKNQFNIKGTNAISANGITYYGIGKVDGKTGAGQLDTVSGSNTWDLLTTGFKASGISFFNIEVANSGNNGTVNGTSSKDDIVILNTQSVAANGTRFNQVTKVDTKDNVFSGDLDTVSGSNDWTLLVNGFESSGISFTNVDVANSGENGTLNGTDNDDAFVIKGTQSITANGTTFNQIVNVDAKGDLAASGVDTVSGSNTWNLLAAGFESSGIRFINTEVVNSSANGLLNGTELKDEFMIIGNQSVVVNGTTFNQIASIDAKDSLETNELDTVSGSNIWALLSNGFESTGIKFVNIEVANSGSKGRLSGTNNADQFIIKGSQSVAANGTTFNQIVGVDAKDASSFGDMDTVSGSNTWDLLSVGFRAADIHFTNTEVANSGAEGIVNGTEFKDEFLISGIQSVKANGTTFNQVTKIDAKNNTLSQFDTVSGSNTWDILAEGFKASEINFFNIEIANSGGAGLINGTELQDEFEITGTQSVAINGTTFNQIAQVDAKGNTVEGELDTVFGSNTWDLLSEGFKASGISFLNTEIANSGSEGVLNGTNITDEFYLAGLQSVTANNTTFNQVASVNAQGGNNKLVGMAIADEFYLSSVNAGIDMKVTSQGIDFNNIINIDGGAGENRVHGSAGNDIFQLTDTRQELISNNMTFSNIQAVVAADGEDSLIGQDSQRWQVSNIDNTIVAQDIRFSEIETVSNSGLGILIGSDQADQFILVSSNGSATENSVMVDQIIFSNIGSVDAGESELGEDIVISDIEQTWQLTDDNSFIVNGVLLSNIERANAAVSTVMGSISEDVFMTTDITNTVIANDVYFENVTLLDGKNPGLTLTYSADLDAKQNNSNNVDQVAAADKFIINSNNNITIAQGDGVDSFSQSGNQSGLSFDFKNIEVVDVVTSGDVYSTSGFEYLTIDANNLLINTTEDITFNNFDIVNNLTIDSTGDLIFLNDVEFKGKDVSVSGDDVSFRGSLKIASNTFVIAANKLNVEGDIDADVNAERSVATDIGQDINTSIFSSIDIFLASDSSILRKDEIDNADRLKRLLEETELEF